MTHHLIAIGAAFEATLRALLRPRFWLLVGESFHQTICPPGDQPRYLWALGLFAWSTFGALALTAILALLLALQGVL